MIRKFILPLLAVAGVVFALVTVRAGNKKTPVADPVAEPSRAPFTSYVAGSGIVEASTENIAVGTPVAGVVTNVFVKFGDNVKAGDKLFTLDDRDLRAELLVREAAVKSAQAQLDKLKAQPRSEELPVAEAKLQEAKASLTHSRLLLNRWERIEDKSAVNPEELIERRTAAQVDEAKVNQSQADLTLLQRGAWKPDLQIAEAEVAAAEARVRAAQIDIDRLTIRAPVDGQVLQVKIRTGEFAPVGALQTPLMLIGDTRTLHVRVDVDENDASHVAPSARAIAFVRGNVALKVDLAFFKIEPYVVPKRSLTGDSTERVDTRVLQVLYQFSRSDLPVYVGQQMDVYVEAPPIGTGRNAVE